MDNRSRLNQLNPQQIAAMKKRAQQKERFKKVVAYALLTLGALFTVIPFVWTISTALKIEADETDGLWIPRTVTFKNFEKAWIQGKFGLAYRNSIIVATLVTIGQVFTSALAAYAFARLTWTGRDKLFVGYLGTMMIPFVVIMIPNYILLQQFGLIDTLTGLILPMMFSAYGTFMLRQFFLGIPRSLEEAAVIDGASRLSVFFRIILPLSKAALSTLVTFTFIFVWNDFMWPLIVVSSTKWKTLPLMLDHFQSQYSSQYALIMSGSLIVLLPVLLIYIINQKFITRGITLSGLKG